MESYSKYMLFSIKVSLTIMLAVIMIGLLRLTDNYLKWGFRGSWIADINGLYVINSSIDHV